MAKKTRNKKGQFVKGHRKVAKSGARRRKRKNPSSAPKASNPRRTRRRRAAKGTTRRRRRNPSTVMATSAPKASNPSRRRRGHRRRKNPSGEGIGHVLGQVALATGGTIVGVGLSRLADMFIPVGTGALAAIEMGSGLLLGGGLYFVSPAAGLGLAGGLVGPGGLKLLDVLVPATTPSKPSTSKPAQGSASALTGGNILRLLPGQVIAPVNGQQALGRIELEMGAVEIRQDTVRTLGAVEIDTPNVAVSGVDIDDMGAVEVNRYAARGY